MGVLCKLMYLIDENWSVPTSGSDENIVEWETVFETGIIPVDMAMKNRAIPDDRQWCSLDMVDAADIAHIVMNAAISWRFSHFMD